MIPEKVGFVEYVYLRHLSPIIELLLGLLLLVVVICLSPILIPYLIWVGWKSEYEDYCDFFKEKD